MDENTGFPYWPRPEWLVAPPQDGENERSAGDEPQDELPKFL